MFKKISTTQYISLCIFLFLLLLSCMVFAIYVGAIEIEASWIYKIIVNQGSGKTIFTATWPKYIEGIVWGMRLPKVIVVACVGAGLSLVGILMQSLTKNTLADPYILGISSGASTGATAVLLLGTLPFLGAISVQLGAFIGAMISAVLVFTLGGKRSNTTKLVLTGVAISSLFSALTNIMIFMTPESRKVNSALFWMTGSFASVEWHDVLPVVITLIITIVFMLWIHKALDAMLLGEELAITIGVNVTTIKIIIILISTLITGVMVSICGVIGFVGLLIPHISRSIIGTTHTRLIPFSALLGGIFLVLADTIARVVVAPAELPIGVITAILGVPFFLVLLKRSSYSFSER